MTTASLTTALLVSLPTVFFVLLARRSKRSEEEILIFRSSSCCCVETDQRGTMIRVHGPDPRRSSRLSSFVQGITVAVFLSGWCSLAAHAVVIPSRVGVVAGAESIMTLRGLSAWRRGRGLGKPGSADGASQRCVTGIQGACGICVSVRITETLTPLFLSLIHISEPTRPY